jgi:hypothetical protein
MVVVAEGETRRQELTRGLVPMEMVDYHALALKEEDWPTIRREAEPLPP